MNLGFKALTRAWVQRQNSNKTDAMQVGKSHKNLFGTLERSEFDVLNYEHNIKIREIRIYKSYGTFKSLLMGPTPK
jgi:hypothetical protein